MIKNTVGKMDYFGKLVLSDGITTVSDIHLVFSDNIVKVRPVPLPPPIDISLKDRTEIGNILIYGLQLSSANYISIGDPKDTEFKDLKKYLLADGVNTNIISADKMRLIFPTAKQSNIDKYLPYINKYFELFEINTCDRINHFFSQVEGEVVQFHYNIENIKAHVKNKNKIINSVFCTNSTKNTYRKYACENPEEFVGKPQKFANYVYGTMLGNSAPISGDDEEGKGDGWRYRGRGSHQLTGLSNYTEFNEAIPKYLKDRSVDVVDNPDLVGEDPELYILSAIWHWDSHHGNTAADKKNCDPCKCSKICPDDNCVGNVTKVVNGGCNGINVRNDSYIRIIDKNKCN